MNYVEIAGGRVRIEEQPNWGGPRTKWAVQVLKAIGWRTVGSYWVKGSAIKRALKEAAKVTR
jgi:hypothetical protein